MRGDGEVGEEEVKLVLPREISVGGFERHDQKIDKEEEVEEEAKA